MKRSLFAKATWLVLVYTLVVIAWGAFVRASFSGDGCGVHWPDCGGTLLPSDAPLKLWIEFGHRVTSGLLLPFVIGLAIWARRIYPAGHQVRKAAFWVVPFTIAEALVGAWLVLSQRVAHDDSVMRVVEMAIHLTTTFSLLASMTATVVFAERASESSDPTSSNGAIVIKGQGPILGAILFGMACLVVLGVSGVISALGHQLKPVDDVLQAAMAPGAHFLNRLQPLHPLIATSVGLYILLMGGLLTHLRPSADVKNAVQWMVGAYCAQFAVGALNIWIKAPIWMQLLHLVTADACWITLVMTALCALRKDAPRRDVDVVDHSDQEERPAGRALVKEYVALTKPKVISLLLFTTMMAMFAAAKGWPGSVVFWGLLIGGYMSAGAANAINMVIDRDIDRTMKRTSTRPTVTENVPSHHALFFGFALAGLSFVTIWASSNLLAAMLSLAGLVFYVIVYTLMLKRRTWQNIVIGGAAGCFPPLVGWAAVTDQLSMFAVVLFAIIFMWTPVHFWALALLIKDDYAKAGIPMLPVVRGERVTVIQITFYGVLTALVSALPLMQREAGWLYMGTILLLNSVLIVRCLSLYRNVDRPHAASLYKFSLAYLFLLFLSVAVDRAFLAVPAPKPQPLVVSRGLPDGKVGLHQDGFVRITRKGV